MAQGQKLEKAETYKKLFKEADSNGDGYLTIQELKALLVKGGSKMSDKEVADAFICFDGPKGDRRISFKEFCDGLDRILEFIQKLEELFRQIDTSKDGYLDRNEMKALLARSGKKFTEAEVNDIVKEADVNGDNKISFKEFVDACTHM